MGFVQTILVLSVGFFIRIWLIESPFYQWVSLKIEFNTPISSWKRMEEGLHLLNRGLSPYEGDVFHQTPLMLYFMSWLTSHWKKVIPGIFAIIDMFTAYVLSLAAHEVNKYLLLEQERRRPGYSQEGQKSHAISKDGQHSMPLYTLLIHSFSPLAIGSCLARSLGIFDNLLLALVILYTAKGNRLMSTLFTALASYQGLYPAMLIAPVSIVFAEMDIPGVVRYSRRPARVSIGKTVALYLLFLGSLLYVSSLTSGGWNYISSVYGLMYTVSDLTPNMGLFWYFFTEMFEHFRSFFLVVFQVNAFFYTLPLSFKFRRSPMFVLYCLLILTAVFKSYPSYTDLCVYMALLPCWSFLFKYTTNTFLVCNMLLWCGVLAPVLYHLWIYSGSANANFFYVVTLVFNTAQIFFLMDLIGSFLRREFHLHTQQKGVDDKTPLSMQ